MNRTRHFCLIAACLGVFARIATASSIDLAVEPSLLNLAFERGSEIDLSISGLGAFSPPSLSTFDLNLSFNPQVIAIENVQFGGSSGDELDLEGAGSITDSSQPSPGILHVFELSLDPAATLDVLQPGSFVLARIDIAALGLGSSPLSLAVNALADASGNPLAAGGISGSLVQVGAPEPQPFFLLAVVGVALFGRFRLAKFRKR